MIKNRYLKITKSIVPKCEGGLVSSPIEKTDIIIHLNSPLTVTLDGERIECRYLWIENNREIYCIPVNGEKYSRININLLEKEDLKMIDDIMQNDIKKTEE